MNDLDLARSQMAMSLGFHIVFAAMGIGMPVLICVAEALHHRTGRAVSLDLRKRWARCFVFARTTAVALFLTPEKP
jgi:cytochrome d ubiquinol oxidase subunit I